MARGSFAKHGRNMPDKHIALDTNVILKRRAIAVGNLRTELDQIRNDRLKPQLGGRDITDGLDERVPLPYDIGSIRVYGYIFLAFAILVPFLPQRQSHQRSADRSIPTNPVKSIIFTPIPANLDVSIIFFFLGLMCIIPTTDFAKSCAASLSYKFNKLVNLFRYKPPVSNADLLAATETKQKVEINIPDNLTCFIEKAIITDPCHIEIYHAETQSWKVFGDQDIHYEKETLKKWLTINNTIPHTSMAFDKKIHRIVDSPKIKRTVDNFMDGLIRHHKLDVVVTPSIQRIT